VGNGKENSLLYLGVQVVMSSQEETTMYPPSRMKTKRFSCNKKQSFHVAMALLYMGLQKEREGGLFLYFSFSIYSGPENGCLFSQFHFPHVMNMEP
jgi:hypothetical protein